jgi:hypothetical protein
MGSAWSQLPAQRGRLELLKTLAAEHDPGLIQEGVGLNPNRAGRVSAGCGMVAGCWVLGACLVTRAVAQDRGALGGEAAEHEGQNEHAVRRPARRIGS